MPSAPIEAFSTFMKIAEQLSAQLKVIEESSHEQNQGIAEIERAVDNMNTVIQANAASAGKPRQSQRN